MSAKQEMQLLPLELGGAAFLKAVCCSAGSCLISTFADTPSISWIANSTVASDGEISVDAAYDGWQMKGTIRAEWPWAVALYRHAENIAFNAVFVYDLAQKSYRSYKLQTEASMVLLMSYERALVVQKDGFLIIDLFAAEAETSFVPCKPLAYAMPQLCLSKSKEILLCSMNDIQVWRFEFPERSYGTLETKTSNTITTNLIYSSHIDGVGYSEVAWHGTCIVAVYNSGTMVHVADTVEGDDDEACDISQPVPVTKIFIDDTYLVMGLADGAVRVYGADRLNFISQLNLSQDTLQPSRAASSGINASYPYKVSYISRVAEFVVTTAVDSDTRQLQVSVWALKGSYSVLPLRSKLIVGTVTNVYCDPTQALVVAVSQVSQLQSALTRWKLDMKQLSTLLSKWKSTNEANQDTLASDMMREVLTAPGIFKALMRLSLSSSRVEVVGEALYTALKSNADALQQLVNTALDFELESFSPTSLETLAVHFSGSSNLSPIHRPSHSASSSSSSIPSHRSRHASVAGTRLSGDRTSPRIVEPTTTWRDGSESVSSNDSDEGQIMKYSQDSSTEQSISKPSSRRVSLQSDDRSFGSIDSSSSVHWTMGSLTSSVLSNYLVNSCHVYNFVALSDPLSLLAKSDSKYVFSITSDDTSAESRIMLKKMMKIVTSIIDNLVLKESYLPLRAVQLLSEYHQRLKALRPDLSDLRAMKLGAGRIFITHFVLAAWLEPVKFGIASKVSMDLSNMYMVAKLLEIICLGSRSEVESRTLLAFKTEQTKRFRAWFLGKLKHPEMHIEKKKRVTSHVGPDLKSSTKSLISGSKSSQKNATAIRNATLVVTQCIIAHHHDLLLELGAYHHTGIASPKSPSSSSSQASNTPNTDVTIALIKIVSNTLLRPIQTIMAKESEKDAKLADQLEVFSDIYSSDSARGSNASSDMNRMMTLSFRLDLDAERRGPALSGYPPTGSGPPTTRKSPPLAHSPDTRTSSDDMMVVDLSDTRSGGSPVPVPSLISARSVKKRLGVSSRHADIVTLRRRSPRNAAAQSSEITAPPLSPSSDKLGSKGTSKVGHLSPASSPVPNSSSAPSAKRRNPMLASASLFEVSGEPSPTHIPNMTVKSRSSEFI